MDSHYAIAAELRLEKVRILAPWGNSTHKLRFGVEL